jgi:hypothetical protein
MHDMLGTRTPTPDKCSVTLNDMSTSLDTDFLLGPRGCEVRHIDTWYRLALPARAVVAALSAAASPGALIALTELGTNRAIWLSASGITSVLDGVDDDEGGWEDLLDLRGEGDHRIIGCDDYDVDASTDNEEDPPEPWRGYSRRRRGDHT